jgi:hypothetical protein
MTPDILLNTTPTILGPLDCQKMTLNYKLFRLVVTALIAGSLFPTMGYAQGAGGSEGGESGAAPDKPAPRPRIRWQQPLKLPEQYRAKDKDKDGQIGLYEWDRKDYATFRKLDLNHDGYLTAEELTRKPLSRSSTTTAAAPPRPPAPPSNGAVTASDSSSGSASEAPASASSDKPAAPNGDAAAPAAAPAASGAGRSDAERQWELLDKDKDGKLTDTEWGKSFLTKKKFADAGIAVSFPMTQEEFVQLYSQLPKTGN